MIIYSHGRGDYYEIKNSDLIIYDRDNKIKFTIDLENLTYYEDLNPLWKCPSHQVLFVYNYGLEEIKWIDIYQFRKLYVQYLLWIKNAS